MRAPLILLSGLLLTAGPVACSPPQSPTARETPVSSGGSLQGPDPHLAALTGEVNDLRATLATARDALVAARDAGDPAAARAAAERAVHALTAAPALAGDLDEDGQVAAPGVAPLFPGPTGAIPPGDSYGDVFSRVLTAARSAGPQGSAVIDLLRNPVAGSLAAWQSDPGGVLDLVVQVADAPDVATAQERISEDLNGQATLALAWALLAVRAEQPATVRAAAERGVVHLDAALEGLEAVDDLASLTPDADATLTP